MAQHPPSVSNVITPKGTVLKAWEPYVVVPFWKQLRGDDDTALSKSLPGYRPCPIVSRLPEPTPLPTKELQIFVNKKLFRDASFEALVMVVVIHLVAQGKQPSDRLDSLLQPEVLSTHSPSQKFSPHSPPQSLSNQMTRCSWKDGR